MREFLEELAAFIGLMFCFFCGMVFLEWMPELLNSLQTWLTEKLR